MAKLPLPISVSILYAPTNVSFIRDEEDLELCGNAMLDGQWYLAGYESGSQALFPDHVDQSFPALVLMHVHTRCEAMGPASVGREFRI